MLTVFGSIIVDQIFKVPSLPKQGETILADQLLVGPGGKGANQAVAAAKSGGQVAMVGTIGSDASAQISMEAFKAAGVNTSGVQQGKGTTGAAAVMVDAKGANAISVAPAANRQTSTAQMTDQIWDKTGTLLMQMEIPLSEVAKAIRQAKARGIRSILNLAPAAPLPTDALEDLDILIANEVELEMLAEHLGLQRSDHHTLAQDVSQKMHLDLIVTLGEKGALLIKGHETTVVEALSIEAVDTTGAGDAFCGVFAAALDKGLSMDEAMQRGCIAGSLACLKTGAQESLPTAEEIEAKL